MTARFSLGRTLAVAGMVAAVAVPLSAGPAFAGTQPHNPPAPAQNTGHPTPTPTLSTGHPKPGPHHDTVTALRTKKRDAHIRTSPSLDQHGRDVSTLHARGSVVVVTCRTKGVRLHGTRTWYRTIAPARGFISASEVARPVHPVRRCQ